MGFVRKITGAQKSIDAVNRQTNEQIAAAKQAADAQVRALNDAASATADSQRMMAERTRVEAAASDAASKPLAVADVALDPEVTGSIVAAKRKARAQFGKGYTSGIRV
jgi:hypothetical protein